ncbi:MAG: DUF4830 domain-containing protein [Clostridia bacterium]|nr:DUF4830 domain-containing protein [Clostridia bacterium]
MFVFSVRASTVRFFAILALTVGLAFAWFIIGGKPAVAASAGETYVFTGAKTEEGRKAFLSQFGIEVTGDAAETEDFCLPADFDRVLGGYNEVQKAQGLNLEKYKGRKLTRYTYRVANAEGEGDVFVNLLVKRDLVVGCDFSSTEPGGFVKPLTEFRPESAPAPAETDGSSESDPPASDPQNPSEPQTPSDNAQTSLMRA